MLVNWVTGLPLRLVMFDLDGTLVDSVLDLKAALDGMYRDIGLSSASEQQVRSWVGNGAAILVKRALAYDLDESKTPENDQFQTAYASFQRHYHHTNGAHSRCYEGVHELIAELKAGRVPVAIVTNKPMAFTRPLLAKLNLNVDLVLGGDSLKEKKPSPEPLLHSMAMFSVSAEHAVMVGDSMHDILAAKRAGVPSIAVSYGYNHGVSILDAGPDLLVDSLNELR